MPTTSKLKKYQSPTEKKLTKAIEDLDLITTYANHKKQEVESANQNIQAKQKELKSQEEKFDITKKTQQTKEAEYLKAVSVEDQARNTYQDKLNFETSLKNEVKNKAEAADNAADQLLSAQNARKAIARDEQEPQCQSPHSRADFICFSNKQAIKQRNNQKQKQRQDADQNINLKQDAKNNADTAAKNAKNAADAAHILTNEAEQRFNKALKAKNIAFTDYLYAKKMAEEAENHKASILEQLNKANMHKVDVEKALIEALAKQNQAQTLLNKVQKEFAKEQELMFGDNQDEDIDVGRYHDYSNSKTTIDISGVVVEVMGNDLQFEYQN